jgi:hypothetical protein
MRELLESLSKSSGLTPEELQEFKEEGQISIQSSFYKDGLEVSDSETRAGKQPSDKILSRAGQAKAFAAELDRMLSGSGLKPTKNKYITMDVREDELRIALDLTAKNGLSAEITVEYADGKTEFRMDFDLSDHPELDFNPAKWSSSDGDILTRIKNGALALRELTDDVNDFRKFWPDFGKGR